jgi:hypothetical protein
MRGLREGRTAGSRARLLAAAALALTTAAGEARANQTFSLSGVKFSDGGTATGSFTTNDAVTSLVTYNITTSPEPGFGFNYTPATASSSPSRLPTMLALITPPVDNTPSRELILEFEFLTADVALIISPISAETGFTPGGSSVQRSVVEGQIVGAGVGAGPGVPGPSSLLTGGVASLAGLGAWARRRRAG